MHTNHTKCHFINSLDMMLREVSIVARRCQEASNIFRNPKPKRPIIVRIFSLLRCSWLSSGSVALSSEFGEIGAQKPTIQYLLCLDPEDIALPTSTSPTSKSKKTQGFLFRKDKRLSLEKENPGDYKSCQVALLGCRWGASPNRQPETHGHTSPGIACGFLPVWVVGFRHFRPRDSKLRLTDPFLDSQPGMKSNLRFFLK